MRKIVLVIIVLVALLGSFALVRYQFTPHVKLAPTTLEVEQGMTVDEIIRHLKEKELIRSESIAKMYLALRNDAKNLQAGKYTFQGDGVSLKSIFDTLTAGTGGRPERSVTIIEGWTVEDMGEYLEKENIMNKNDFVRAVSTKKYNFDFLQFIPNTRDDLEGYLFPDTYRVFHDISPEELVEKMLKNFENKVGKETLENNTLDDIIILASIIERELLTFEEKQIGAGVFFNRLETGIALQADSTVNYITGKDTPRASARDISIDNPYNTYKYRGLPPGPISNPGLDSIHAVLNPKEHDYFYFLTTPEGKAIFSKTLDEHNTAKNKYY